MFGVLQVPQITNQLFITASTAVPLYKTKRATGFRIVFAIDYKCEDRKNENKLIHIENCNNIGVIRLILTSSFKNLYHRPRKNLSFIQEMHLKVLLFRSRSWNLEIVKV